MLRRLGAAPSAPQIFDTAMPTPFVDNRPSGTGRGQGGCGNAGKGERRKRLFSVMAVCVALPEERRLLSARCIQQSLRGYGRMRKSC